MSSNSNCNWVEWNVPDSVMNDYEGYISDYDCYLIDLCPNHKYILTLGKCGVSSVNSRRFHFKISDSVDK